MNWFYAVSNLGTLPGGQTSVATGINASGDVVGYADTGLGHTHAFLFSHGIMTDLGSLMGPNGNSYAVAINNSGDVVGWSAEPGGSGSLHAFRYRNGQMIDLGTLGGHGSRAYDINSSGDVVGAAVTASGVIHAFLYTGGQMIDLGTLGGESWAYAINDAGRIVGDSNGQAFLYTGGQMQVLGTLTHAFDINASDQVAGQLNQRAVLYEVFGPRDLGTLGGQESTSLALNEAAEVVGFADVSATVTGVPFVWDRVDGIANMNNLLGLNSAGWEVLESNDINGRGQIVGRMSPANAQFPTLGFVLTPLYVDPTPFRYNIDDLLNMALRFLSGRGVPIGPYRPIPGDPPLEHRLNREILLGATVNDIAAQIGNGELRRAIQGRALDLVIQSAQELAKLQASMPSDGWRLSLRADAARKFGKFGRLGDPDQFRSERQG